MGHFSTHSNSNKYMLFEIVDLELKKETHYIFAGEWLLMKKESSL